MEWIFGGVVLFVIAGVVLAIYEKRKGLRVRDERGSAGGSVSAMQAGDQHRAQDAFRHDGGHSGDTGGDGGGGGG